MENPSTNLIESISTSKIGTAFNKVPPILDQYLDLFSRFVKDPLETLEDIVQYAALFRQILEKASTNLLIKNVNAELKKAPYYNDNQLEDFI
jgi:hypothetical protein